MNRNQEPLYTLCAHSLSPGASPDDRRTESLNSVNGAPRTRQSGARTATADVAAICTLITAGAYLPTPDDVATSNTRHPRAQLTRSEEHTSELQSLMRISYAVFCFKKKKTHRTATKSQK